MMFNVQRASGPFRGCTWPYCNYFVALKGFITVKFLVVASGRVVGGSIPAGSFLL